MLHYGKLKSQHKGMVIDFVLKRAEVKDAELLARMLKLYVRQFGLFRRYYRS